MRIIRDDSGEQHFTAVPNAVARDERLSFTARGVLLDLLSRPADWRPTVETYRKLQTSPPSRRQISGAFSQLGAVGYLHRIRESTGRGGMVMRVFVYESPVQFCGDSRCADCQANGRTGNQQDGR